MRFVAEDPMTASGVRASVEIYEWRMAVFDRRYMLPPSDPVAVGPEAEPVPHG